MYGDLRNIAMSNTKIHIHHMNATNNMLTARNYNSNQVPIEWRLLDKNIMTLTTDVANSKHNTSLFCETYLEIFVEKQIFDKLIRVRVSPI
jgi:hypothetical protein